MKKNIAFLLFLPLLLFSCALKTDVTKTSRYRAAVGHTLVTKVPLKLYDIDYQLNGYRDRYDIGDQVLGQPLIGIVPAGHPLLFQRIIWFSSLDTSKQSLEGIIDFRGKTYPIAYDLSDSENDESNMWKSLHHDFVIPFSK